MPGWLRKLWPSKLKNRIFLAFLIVVFIPFTSLQLNKYNQIQTKINRQISQLNMNQIGYMIGVLEDARLTGQNSVLQMELDRRVRDALAIENADERDAAVQGAIAAVKSQYLPLSSYIHYTVIDNRQRIYTSSPSSFKGERAELEMKLASEFDQQLPQDERWKWILMPEGDWLLDVVKSSPVLTLYSRASGAGPLAIRASIDLNEWLRSTASSLQFKQNYYLLDESGQTITQSASGFAIEPGLKQKLLQIGKYAPESYALDSTDTYVFNARYIPALGWYVVSQFPLDYFFGDIESMKRQLIAEMAVVTVFFVIVAFLMLSTLTRPLRLVEKKMREAKEKWLSIKLSEGGHKGEILSFIRTFNGMIDDINRLIRQLRAEERQKEALRFQMLLAQINPHFILNTLNAIKWSAWNAGDKGTAEMCKALGKLLETSLNAEEDLVYLKHELELLQAYVYLQMFRYGNAFEMVYECDPALDYALVPKLSLQPLVENALVHGLVHRQKDGCIRVQAKWEQDRLVIEVRDNGIGIGNAPANHARKRKGIGIDNLRERLSLLFRGEGRLELIALEAGTAARMTLPILLSNPHEAASVHSGFSMEG